MRRRFSLPIRWRLALTSAGLTFVILLAFAGVIGAFTTTRLRADFDSDLKADASDLATRLPTRQDRLVGRTLRLDKSRRLALNVAASSDAAVRVLDADGSVAAQAPPGIGKLGPTDTETVRDFYNEACGCVYRVYTRGIYPEGTQGGPAGLAAGAEPDVFLQFGRQRATLDTTITRVRTFLGLGVLAGTALALLAGLAVARRAMTPIADLTYVASHVGRTRDPAVTLPPAHGRDEVADLNRTLREMLHALDAARTEIESGLQREREFMADASHELRTPLTSVLANLELLEAELDGEPAEIAQSALRSTHRMRRLVADLLFLARADAGRESPMVPVDFGQVVQDAAAETAPLSVDHAMRVEAPTGVLVLGVADDLHRLVVNLVQNAVSHTPPGTIVRVRLRRKAGTLRPAENGGEGSQQGAAILEVSDNGPGLSEDLRERIFERFVRGGRSPRSAGSGLGLAIVAAVAHGHGGTVKVTESPDGGARFVVRLPIVQPAENAAGEAPPTEVDGAEQAQTSTTTGRTSGRRLRRS
jgi:two-component system, OmpR family, sensor kinase